MNYAYRNPALQRLNATATGLLLSDRSEEHYQAGQILAIGAASSSQLWFPESGVLVLEQDTGARHVEVALIGCTTGLSLPQQADLRLRALTEGRAQVLSAQVVLSIWPEVFLQCQQELMQQMARWSWCVQHHSLLQGLADRLLWAHLAGLQDVLAWSLHDLPGGQMASPAQMDGALQALANIGAIDLHGSQLRVQNPHLLETMACGCHSKTIARGAGSSAATGDPSVNA
jgi:hypothetical protein